MIICTQNGNGYQILTLENLCWSYLHDVIILVVSGRVTAASVDSCISMNKRLASCKCDRYLVASILAIPQYNRLYIAVASVVNVASKQTSVCERFSKHLLPPVDTSVTRSTKLGQSPCHSPVMFVCSLSCVGEEKTRARSQECQGWTQIRSD